MLHPDTFPFLKDLKKNNTRDWFQANKSRYQEVKNSFDFFVEVTINELRKIDPRIGPVTPKDCVFRIYRDVRFSKDKSPYKNHLGAAISRGGRKGSLAGYYMHFENGGSFLAGGLYMPPKEIITPVRREIFDNTQEFKEIISSPKFKQHFSTLSGEKLKRAPRDYDEGFEDIELIKHKSFLMYKVLPDDLVSSEILLNEVKDVFSAMRPLNDFLNNVVEEVVGRA